MLTAIACLCFSGCHTVRDRHKAEANIIGTLAVTAVANKFPDIPKEHIRWAYVFSAVYSNLAGNEGGSITVDLLDIRTLRKGSYYSPKVRRFRVEMNLDHTIISVEKDVDGVLLEIEDEEISSNHQMQGTARKPRRP